MWCGGPAAQTRGAWPLASTCGRTTAKSPDLLDLLARRDADGRPAMRIVEALATEAPGDTLAALALLHMIRGDLEVMSKRLVHSGRVSTLDAEADTLSAAWEVVTRRPPPGRWERADAMWNQARRASRMRRQRCPETEPLPRGLRRGRTRRRLARRSAGSPGRCRGGRRAHPERRGPDRADPGGGRTARRGGPGTRPPLRRRCVWSAAGPKRRCGHSPGATSREGRNGSAPHRCARYRRGSRCWAASVSQRLRAVRSALASMARAPRSHRPKSSGAPRRPALAAVSAPTKSPSLHQVSTEALGAFGHGHRDGAAQVLLAHPLEGVRRHALKGSPAHQGQRLGPQRPGRLATDGVGLSIEPLEDDPVQSTPWIR